MLLRFWNRLTKKDTQIITELANKIQNLINELFSREPDNKTFEQEGMLNGSKIVQEYLDEGEYGIAVEHLLYIVYESDVVSPNEIIEQLTELAQRFKINNPYL